MEDYWILCVQRNGEEVSPAAHYCFEHTFTWRVWPKEVSFAEPLHISTNLIVDSISTRNGIAVKKGDETRWKIYWLSKADIAHINRHDVMILPRYEKLPHLFPDKAIEA